MHITGRKDYGDIFIINIFDNFILLSTLAVCCLNTFTDIEFNSKSLLSAILFLQLVRLFSFLFMYITVGLVNVHILIYLLWCCTLILFPSQVFITAVTGLIAAIGYHYSVHEYNSMESNIQDEELSDYHQNIKYLSVYKTMISNSMCTFFASIIIIIVHYYYSVVLALILT